MLTKINKAINFIVNVFVLLVVIAFLQPSEAKVYESLLTLGLQVRQITQQEPKQIIGIFDLTFNHDVTNVQLLIDRLQSVKGVLLLHVDGINKRQFKVAFDPETTNQTELILVIYLLTIDPKLYGE